MLIQLPIAFISPIHLEYLRAWQAVLLFALLAAPIVLLGVRSLAGLGPVRKWVAIGIRLLVLVVFVLVIGGVRFVRENKTAEVMVLRDISLSTGLTHDYPGKTLTSSVDDYLRGVADEKHKPGEDRIGVISFAANALIDAIPSPRLLLESRAIRDPGNGTDAAAAIQLALATLSKDAMHRLVLMWDGNATTGELDTAINAAAAQHIPIDVMPLRYDVQHEVLVDKFIAPAWKRENEPFSMEVILRSTNAVAVTGKLRVFHESQPMDLDPATPGVQDTRLITLKPGRNVEHVMVPALGGSNVIHSFHAVFEADQVNASAAIAGEIGGSKAAAAAERDGDTLLKNNTADAFTFVRGKGKVLYVDNVQDNRGELLSKALAGEGINLDRITGPDNFPRDLIALQNYDAVILANVSRGAEGLSEEQQKMLAAYVHDMGGGLVMIGGENSLGAGGWQGSRLEEVLPVTMDIPAQRQLPKGALFLIIDAIEQDEGNYWAEQCALKAVDTLSAQDDVAVISGWGGVQWDYPLGPKGDGTKVKSAIKSMNPGDFPSFDEMMSAALHGNNGVGGLLNNDAQAKHVILISDDDPAPASQATLDEYKKAKISVSTIIDFPHGGSATGIMTDISKQTGGRVYGPILNNIAQLPQIFIKEATVVRRSLIYENHNGIPLNTTASNSELMKGLSTLPPITGMVLTGRKQSPQIEIPIVAGKNNDPVLAHWQTGLGKAVVWASDAQNKWATQWLSSGQYEKFWAQVVRSVSRPPQSSDFDVKTTVDNGRGHIEVEALSKDSRFLNFLSIGGQVVGPDSKPRTVHFVQTGPGSYSGEFEANDPGNYVAVMNYRGGGVPAGGAPGAGGPAGGVMLSGMAVNDSPELRDLKSNDSVLQAIADRTGGRVLAPFDADHADLFTREGLIPTSSPLPIWDIMIPVLLGLVLMDVATRRIAWDWIATKRMVAAVTGRVRAATTVQKVETRQSLDALKRVREEGTAAQIGKRETRPAVAPPPRPDPTAKFEAKGVEGDIGSLVGGATDKPLPSAPKKIEPKGATDSMGGLMAAKRRAQQKIKEKEQGE